MTNIIDFDAKKYVFEEIEGKGKCLVPYKAPKKKPAKHYFEPGDMISFKHYDTLIKGVVSSLYPGYAVISLSSDYTGQAYFDRVETKDELNNFLKNYQEVKYLGKAEDIIKLMI